MVLETTIENWRDIILKVPCFHCRNLGAKISSSIYVYNWLTTFKYSDLSELEFLIPMWISNLQSSQCRVCVNFKCTAQNGSNDRIFFWMNWFCLAGMMKFLPEVLKFLNCTWVYASMFTFFLVITILESNTTSVKRTITNAKTSVDIVANPLKFRSFSDQS